MNDNYQPRTAGDLGETLRQKPALEADQRQAGYVVNLPSNVETNPQTKSRGIVVELPVDMTMQQIRTLFPAGEFRFVQKPCGVLRIQRVEIREGRSRLINAGTVRLSDMRLLAATK